MPPISTPLPGMPVLKPARNLPSPVTRVTVLPNKLRVATEETYGQVATIGLFVDAGSMYEVESTRGAGHFLQNLAFKSTTRMSQEQILQANIEHGIGMTATQSKDMIVYRADALRASAREATQLIADTVIRPLFTAEELAECEQVISYQMEDLFSNPQLVLPELVHEAAYGDSPLGRTHYCDIERLGKVTAADLQRHMGRHFTSDRMVLSGVGVDHEELVEYATEFFSDLRTTPSESFSPPVPSPYVGGSCIVAPKVELPNGLSHVCIAFPAGGWSSADIVPVCVLDMLLGGGSSFSAGGPGKGMYSRLYREVLNVYGWVESANAFNIQLTHQGLFGISGSALPNDIAGMVSLICMQLSELAERKVQPDELDRARNQLQSSVLMNLETRGVLCEDIGRQIVMLGQRFPPSELCSRIAAVTADDIQRIVVRALKSKPSMAVYGEAPNVAYDDVARIFA